MHYIANSRNEAIESDKEVSEACTTTHDGHGTCLDAILVQKRLEVFHHKSIL